MGRTEAGRVVDILGIERREATVPAGTATLWGLWKSLLVVSSQHILHDRCDDGSCHPRWGVNNLAIPLQSIDLSSKTFFQ
jgi:hypothetical protein